MFKLASSPYLQAKQSTTIVMLWVILAMLPGILANVIYFGLGIVVQIILAVVSAFVIEIAVAKMRGKPSLFYISDLSGVLTVVILAVAIPSYAPFWVIITGSIVALLLGKHIYGGLGQNIFNPAMVAYAFLLISFPEQMSLWPQASEIAKQSLSINEVLELIFGKHLQTADAITGATTLMNLKNPVNHSLVLSSDKLNGSLLGWWQINLGFLIGGVILFLKRIIHWHIPVAILATLAILTFLRQFFTTEEFAIVAIQLFSGSTMFGAFFVATDPVSASTTMRGKLIFGLLIGTLLFVIRNFGSYPDAFAFSVLLANLCVPIIDHYTQPKIYGMRD